MALNNNAKNAMLSGLAGVATYASLHDDDPGATGDNELSGGSYARKQVTWDSPANGEMALVTQPEFDVPATSTVKYMGLWSAASSGTFYGYGPVDEESFANAGKYKVTSFTVTFSDPS